MAQILIQSVTQFDVFVFNHIFSWSGKKFFNNLFYLISWSGNGHLYGIFGIYLLLMGGPSGRNILYIGLVAFAFELLGYSFIKRSTKRIRPFERLKDIKCLVKPPDKYSFPSGHTAAAYLMASLFSLYWPDFSWLFFGWASTVGFSRVYLGVHYPTDILAGIILGMCAFQCSVWVII